MTVEPIGKMPTILHWVEAAAVIHVLAEQGALEHVLAQIEELRAAQPTDSDVVPPSIDYEALAREAMSLAAQKLPIKTRFMARGGGQQ